MSDRDRIVTNPVGQPRGGSPSRYVVVDVGCIECGESSVIVGIFDDKGRADAVAEAYTQERDGTDGVYFSGGQHYVEVLEAPNDPA